MHDIENLESGWKGHRKFAEWLVNYKKPETIVELGVDFGYSLFCLANPGIGKVYGIDSFEGDFYTGVHPNAIGWVKKIIKENEYKNIEIIKGYFDNVVKTWDKEIDILHIDGFHTYQETLNDYNKWTKFLNSKSVVLMHDVESFQNVKVVYQLSNLHKVRFTHSNGLGVLSPDIDIINKIKEEFDVIS